MRRLVRVGRASTTGECEDVRRQVATRVDHTVGSQWRVARSKRQKIRGGGVLHTPCTDFLGPNGAYADITYDIDMPPDFRGLRTKVQHGIEGMGLLLDMLHFGRRKAALGRIGAIADRRISRPQR